MTHDPMIRAEHFVWCKTRAMEYVDSGDLAQAVTSMISDMGKHPEIKVSIDAAANGMMLVSEGPVAVELWINGFNDMGQHLGTTRVADHLPPLCYMKHPKDGRTVLIVRGERGYRDISPKDKDADMDVDRLNKKAGITPAQARAMQVGSVFGWNVPGANPKHHR